MILDIGQNNSKISSMSYALFLPDTFIKLRVTITVLIPDMIMGKIGLHYYTI